MEDKDGSTRTQDPPPYKPLNPNGREIRLIQFTPIISPETTSEAANAVAFSCSVDVYPLDAYTEEYTAFEAQIESECSAAKKLQDWKSSRREAYAARFRWGDYVAMSHTWGEKSLFRPVSVNGRVIQVSQNLVQGLTALSRYPAIASGGLKVWNDFLCLDQQNKVEVQRELKNMATIFSTAYEVVAWIGPALDRDGLAMVKLQQIGAETKSDEELYEDIRSMRTEVWAALACFCEREYWRRMWVVQELILGGPETALLCGNDSAPLHAMWRLAAVIVKNASTAHRQLASSLDEGNGYYSDLRHNTLSVCSRLIYLRGIDNCLRKGTDCNILRLLDICRGSLQQDARDKVYGILGLLPPQVTSLIAPDLDKTAHEVYTDLARATIRGMKRLDLLQNSRLDATHIKYPTWTPDLLIKNMSHALGTPDIVNAGGDLDTPPNFSADGRFLHCQGLIIDVIDHLTPSLWPLVPVTSEEIKESTPLSTCSPGDMSELKIALWKTLVGGSANGDFDSSAPEEYARILELNWPQITDEDEIPDVAVGIISEGWCSSDEKQDLTTFLRLLHRASRDFDVCGHALASFFGHATPLVNASAETKTSGSQTIKKALRQVGNTMKRRRLAVMGNGRLGAVVRQAQQGDRIAVLRGCSTPLVLRPSKLLPSDPGLENTGDAETYAVVGDCYVHGIMNGETVTGTDSWNNIVLC
ncbi:hypothetical protein AYO20_01454 [Fonsecaea nubica]|uniref:Heterokaryon incompatibility domain-containing protein n=1 Tax=Fonsecaea nubica TaxID=856822 RepID=A0A178DBJ5_9EURO|nr:hypothetical protein AYO20_01454 [Fonsecaea nubica]OAL39136.1 hypothetical protein AYO20_01454 [Fonsecaea nubica]